MGWMKDDERRADFADVVDDPHAINERDYLLHRRWREYWLEQLANNRPTSTIVDTRISGVVPDDMKIIAELPDGSEVDVTYEMFFCCPSKVKFFTFGSDGYIDGVMVKVWLTSNEREKYQDNEVYDGHILAL